MQAVNLVIGYLVIFVALTFYLKVSRRHALNPGDVLGVSVWVKVWSACFFGGLSCGMIFLVLKNLDLVGVAIAISVTLFCVFFHVAVISSSISLLEDGFFVGSRFSGVRYKYSDFDRVSVVRYCVVLKRKRAAMLWLYRRFIRECHRYIKILWSGLRLLGSLGRGWGVKTLILIPEERFKVSTLHYRTAKD